MVCKKLALSIGGLLSLVFAMFVSTASAETKSTWDQIMESKTLRVGVTISEPWFFKDANSTDDAAGVRVGNDVWRGVAPLLGKEIADAMGVKLQLVETTWGSAVAALQSGQFDVMFILDPTPQRALSIDFAPIPVLWYPTGILAHDELKIQNWSELNDPKYKIGAILGTAQDQFITRALPNATITRFQDSGTVIAAFQAGRIDIGVLTAPAADIARGRLKTGQTILPKPINGVAAGAAIRQETDPRWRNYLTTVVAYYYDTGKTQELYDQFMKFRGVDPSKVTPIVREDWPR